MLEVTEGIVLRKTPYSSSSAIVSFYTRKFGQAAFMVRGLGKKGGKSAILEPLTQVEISCNYKPSSQVQSLRSLSLVSPQNTKNNHPFKGAVSLFLCEILNKTLQEESPDEELYGFISSALKNFEMQEYSPDFHLVFLMKLSEYFGFYPMGSASSNTPYFDLLDGTFVGDKNQSIQMLNLEESKIMNLVTAASNGEIELKLSSQERRVALHNIVEYYQIHMEGMGKVKSLRILAELFS